jgi:lipopolysaccharide export system ATP-binding protein
VNNAQEFRSYLHGLGKHELDVAVGVLALLRRADDGGAADRGVWIASVREAFEEIIQRSGSTNSLHDEDSDAFGRFLEEQVVRPLESARVVRRDTADAGWESIRFTPELWEAISPERTALEADSAAVVRVLHGSRAEAFKGPATGAPLTDGSKLSATGLVKVYRRRKVVNEVDLSVRQGEIVGLLGPNGAGKTTTFYMMVGLIPPNVGKVHLDEKDLTSTPMYRRARMGVGYLAQEPSIFRKLTVEQNVMAILETQKLSRKERAARLEELLSELSIAHLRKSKAYALSGGERRRLEITRALVQRPKFMLLDEPFAGIDPIAVNDIQQIVAGLKHRGIGVIISDHNVEQTLEIVDRAYIMYEGRIRVSGSVSELVWSEEVAEIYLGPILTQRMRQRFPKPSAVA